MASLHQLSTANVPFTITFVCALFLFLHALSGAGYVESQSGSLLSSPLSYTHLMTPNAASKPDGFGDFSEHWERFKETFLSCPSAADVDGNDDIVGVKNETNSNDVAGVHRFSRLSAQMATRPEANCIRERLKDTISLFKFNGSSFAQEERAFRFSFDGIPSSYFRNEDTSESDA